MTDAPHPAAAALAERLAAMRAGDAERRRCSADHARECLGLDCPLCEPAAVRDVIDDVLAAEGRGAR